MKLRQTLEHPVNGYWDGGSKQVFDWSIDRLRIGRDTRGVFVRIGCWSANHWFHVAEGKTDKLTLSNAKRHLQQTTRIPCTFEYVE